MRIKIHKEGRKIILIAAILMLVICLLIHLLFSNPVVNSLAALVFILLLIFFLRFFRVPDRKTIPKEGIVFSAADGKVVAIEEVIEKEYFKGKRIQVSVFMSVWDVHINWFPVPSRVKFFKYHPGKYLIARHPKSSELNERTTVVLETINRQEILVRQIAGYVARRVICYAKEGDQANTGNELGFIKFGSRVDIFFPIDSEILVKPGDKVKGLTSPLALLKNH